MAISPQLWRKRRFLSSDFLPERWGPEAFLGLARAAASLCQTPARKRNNFAPKP